MDGARHHLLAGARLAGDEHRRRGGGHGLDELIERLHRRALADHGAKAETLVELLAQVGVLFLQPPLLAGAVDDVQQFVELEGLGDEVGRRRA